MAKCCHSKAVFQKGESEISRVCSHGLLADTGRHDLGGYRFRFCFIFFVRSYKIDCSQYLDRSDVHIPFSRGIHYIVFFKQISVAALGQDRGLFFDYYTTAFSDTVGFSRAI